MTRWFLVALLVVLMVPVAAAQDNPTPDLFGVYFDDLGTVFCRDDIPYYTPFSVYFVYKNPTVPAILGFEAAYYTTAEFLELGVYPPCGIVWPSPPDMGNLWVECSSPQPTSEATPLLRIDYMAMGTEDPESVFFLEKAQNSSQPGENPYIILPDGSFLETQAALPSYTTLCCGIPSVSVGWGTIKSLYR